jgi:hypothetical protein
MRRLELTGRIILAAPFPAAAMDKDDERHLSPPTGPEIESLQGGLAIGHGLPTRHRCLVLRNARAPSFMRALGVGRPSRQQEQDEKQGKSFAHDVTISIALRCMIAVKAARRKAVPLYQSVRGVP